MNNNKSQQASKGIQRQTASDRRGANEKSEQAKDGIGSSEWNRQNQAAPGHQAGHAGSPDRERDTSRYLLDTDMGTYGTEVHDNGRQDRGNAGRVGAAKEEKRPVDEDDQPAPQGTAPRTDNVRKLP